VFFLFFSVAPAFSQQILATFGLGGEFLNYDRGIITNYDEGNSIWITGDETVTNGMLMDVNILFIGKSGLTVSAGTDMIFNFGEDGGVNVDPTIGLGYVYYNEFYVGGILNAVPKIYMRSKTNDGKPFGADIFFAPTLVGGYNFKHFVLGGQVAYLFGPACFISGFRFSLGVGVNVGEVLKKD
jgi:hypothetical protein